MKNDEQLRERYSHILGPDAGPDLLRLVRDLDAAGSAGRPPEGMTAAIDTALRERAAQHRTLQRPHHLARPEQPATDGRAGAGNRRPPAPWRSLGRSLGVAASAGLLLGAVTLAVMLFAEWPKTRTGSTPGSGQALICGEGESKAGADVSQEAAITAAINYAAAPKPGIVIGAGSDALIEPREVRAEKMIAAAAGDRLQVSGFNSRDANPANMVWLVTIDGRSAKDLKRAPGDLELKWRRRYAIIVDAQTGIPAGEFWSSPLQGARQLIADEHVYKAEPECARPLFGTRAQAVIVHRSGGAFHVAPDSNVFPLYASAAERVLQTLQPPAGSQPELARREASRLQEEGSAVELVYPAPGAQLRGGNTYKKALIAVDGSMFSGSLGEVVLGEEQFTHVTPAGRLNGQAEEVTSVNNLSRVLGGRSNVENREEIVQPTAPPARPTAALPTATVLKPAVEATRTRVAATPDPSPTDGPDPGNPGDKEFMAQLRKDAIWHGEWQAALYGDSKPGLLDVSRAPLKQQRLKVNSLKGDGPSYGSLKPPNKDEDYPVWLVQMGITYWPTTHLPASAGGVTVLKPVRGVLYVLVMFEIYEDDWAWSLEHGFRTSIPGSITRTFPAPCVPASEEIVVPHYTPGEPDLKNGFTYTKPSSPPKITRGRVLALMGHILDDTCPNGPIVSARYELMSGPLYKERVLADRPVWIVSVIGRPTEARGGPEDSLRSTEENLPAIVGGRGVFRETNHIYDAETGQFLGAYSWR